MKTRYELSLYEEKRKYICYSFYSPNDFMERWEKHNKPMEKHYCKDGKIIETAKQNVDYIKILND